MDLLPTVQELDEVLSHTIPGAFIFPSCKVEGCPTHISLRAVDLRQGLAWRDSIKDSRKAFSFWPEEQGLLSVTVLSYSFTPDLHYTVQESTTGM